jgi:hypothetical protein
LKEEMSSTTIKIIKSYQRTQLQQWRNEINNGKKIYIVHNRYKKQKKNNKETPLSTRVPVQVETRTKSVSSKNHMLECMTRQDY